MGTEGPLFVCVSECLYCLLLLDTNKSRVISCCASGNVVYLRLLPGTQVIPVLETYFQTLWNNFLYQILNLKLFMVQLTKRNQNRAPPFLHPDGRARTLQVRRRHSNAVLFLHPASNQRPRNSCKLPSSAASSFSLCPFFS